MFHHAIGVNAQPGFAGHAFFQVGKNVHFGRIPPKEERFSIIFCLSHKIYGFGIYFFVNGFHPLFGKWPGIFNTAAGKTVDHTTRTKLLFELRIFWIIFIFRFFLCVQMVEVPEKLIKAMIGR